MAEIKLETPYVDNGDDTVTDKKHDLMWMKSDTWVTLGRLITWHESQALARKMNEEKFAGYSNWRIRSSSEVIFWSAHATSIVKMTDAVSGSIFSSILSGDAFLNSFFKKENIRKKVPAHLALR